MFTEMHNLLQVMASVGVDYLKIIPQGDGTSRISGANDDRDILVWDTVGVEFCDKVIAIFGVKVLLSRFELFDASKSPTLEFDVDADQADSLVIKQGRRKTSFRFYGAKHLGVPSGFDDSLIAEIEDQTLTITKDVHETIKAAIGSMSKTIPTSDKTSSYLSVSSEDGDLKIKIYDGGSDSFDDTYVNLGSKYDCKSNFDIQSFKRVLGRAIESKDECDLALTETGIALFSVDGINVMVNANS